MRVQSPPGGAARSSPGTNPKVSQTPLWIKAFLFIFILIGLVAFVSLRRSAAQSDLVKATQKMAIPTVLVVHPQVESTDVHLVLPGTVQANIQTSIYARVDGYLKRWMVDIGTPVKQGQLLAELETPETDQQLEQTRAMVLQAQANVDIAQTTANRYNNLAASQAVSKQEVDSANAALAAQKASLAADQANANRLEQIEGFKEVYAPFDGTITARKVDVGNLINSGAGTTAKELFEIEQTSVLRVYTNIPEAYGHLAVPGQAAMVQFASTPDQKIKGTLTRTAKAIDPASLTLLTEVDVPNADGKLFPGGYAQVYFDFTTSHPSLVVPGNTLIFRAQGTQVGVVDSKTHLVHLENIKIGRDLGNRIVVVDGLEASDQVIVNPSDSISEGAEVHIQSSMPIASK